MEPNALLFRDLTYIFLAAVGGGLALLKTGDRVRIDLKKRTANILISEAELNERRAALASTLLAGLELARGGTLRLRQQDPFGPILLRRADATQAAATPDATHAPETPNMEGGA